MVFQLASLDDKDIYGQNIYPFTWPQSIHFEYKSLQFCAHYNESIPTGMEIECRELECGAKYKMYDMRDVISHMNSFHPITFFYM